MTKIPIVNALLPILTNGIFIEVLANLIDVKTIVAFLGDWDNPRFNIEVSGEFPNIRYVVSVTYSSATCALAPIKMFGLVVSLPYIKRVFEDIPSFCRFSIQRRFIAIPPRWIASEEPVVAVPIAVSPFGIRQR
jgi:hypothetical protein